MTKSAFIKGIYAGFIATIVLSLLMVLKAMLGMLPNMNAIRMLAGMAHHYLGIPMLPVIGWSLHFMIGSIIWGALFAGLYQRLPAQSPVVKGIIFATVAWLLMMVAVMPLAGAGLFGLHLGLGASIATLVLHWVYGAVLGGMYGKLVTAQFIAKHTHTHA